MRWRSLDIQLLIVLFVAVAIRCVLPGAYQMTWDESRLLYDGMMLARHGRWVWLTSNQAAWILPGHSPLNDYLVALPYLFTANPIGARLFVAALGVIAVAITYLMTKRYFGQRAATITGLLLAVAAPAVEWSRYVWNPNLAPPFIALTIFTGLLGYYEGKQWAQTAHWLALSVAIQAHPGNALLLPLSLFLLVIHWPKTAERRRPYLRATLLGWLIAAISFIPFGIGLLSTGFVQNASRTTESGQAGVSLLGIVRDFSILVGSTNYQLIPRARLTPGNWWPDWNTDNILSAQTLITAAGAIWLIVRGPRRKTHVSGLYLALCTLFPLLSYVLAPFSVQAFYLMAILFAAYPIQGIVLAGLSRLKRWAFYPVGLLVAVFVILQLWLDIGYLRWLTIGGTLENFRAPLSVHQDLLKDWLDNGKEVVILSEGVEGKYGATEQERLWYVVTEGYPVRILRMAQGIPVAPGGEIVVDNYKGATLPAYFGAGEIAGRLSSGDPMFRWVRVTPDMLPKPNILPEGSALFSNGARLLGLSAETKPRAGQDWPISLLWQPQRSAISEQYQFSVRLIDAQNKTYGQFDMASLGGYAWRAGDVVVNRLSIPVPDDLPDSPLTVQVLMYTWPDIKNANVVDEAGNPISQWVLLPIP
jgi:4-amino-4-deoxy-L-arabinose transferase-like glycosyltransferase